MTEGKTLAELDVKPGDVVRFELSSFGRDGVTQKLWAGQALVIDEDLTPKTMSKNNGFMASCGHLFTIVSRANEPDKPKWGPWVSTETWDADSAWLEQLKPGHLQIFIPSGEVVTINQKSDLHSHTWAAWRIRIEPVREIVTLFYGNLNSVSDIKFDMHTHRITFDTIDGKPDCSSITMAECD